MKNIHIFSEHSIDSVEICRLYGAKHGNKVVWNIRLKF